MRTHVNHRLYRHFASEFQCPKCSQTHRNSCIEKRKLLPVYEVHVERVRAMGMNVR